MTDLFEEYETQYKEKMEEVRDQLENEEYIIYKIYCYCIG